MNKLPGNLAAAVLFGALWTLLVGAGDAAPGGRFQWLALVLGQLLSPDPNLTLVALVLVLLAAQYMAGAGLVALLRPLARSLLDRRAQSA